GDERQSGPEEGKEDEDEEREDKEKEEKVDKMDTEEKKDRDKPSGDEEVPPGGGADSGPPAEGPFQKQLVGVQESGGSAYLVQPGGTEGTGEGITPTEPLQEYEKILSQEYWGKTADKTARLQLAAAEGSLSNVPDTADESDYQREVQAHSSKIVTRPRGGHSQVPSRPVTPSDPETPWDQFHEIPQLPEKPPSPPHTPEFRRPATPPPRRVASGFSAGSGAGGSSLPGKPWRDVGPMNKLIHGAKQQMHPSVMNHRGLRMRDVKDANVRLWGQSAKNMDFALRGFVTGALTQVRDSRGMVHLPYVNDHRREHHTTTKDAMAPAPPLKKMVGSIRDIATLDSSYRSTAVIPETGMELPVMVGGGRNPRFIEHMMHRMSFLCQRDEMAAGPEFHQ
ncbi:MAG: hypothetical protein GY821_09945, partial [Gammaproteobacteria bacterium]|nr:hypothetical protein [Gammaproteobacteria bacterium]